MRPVFVLLIVVAILFAALIEFDKPRTLEGGAASEGSQNIDLQEDKPVEGEEPALLRESRPVDESSSEVVEQQQVLDEPEVELREQILKCLYSEEPMVCIDGLDFTQMSPEDVGRIVQNFHGKRGVALDFLCVVLLQRSPADAIEFLDRLHVLAESGSPQQSHWPEAALKQMQSDHPTWVEDFLSSLTPGSFFKEGQSDIMTLAVLYLEKPESIDRMIAEGAKGEWGGTPGQIGRAFNVTLSRLSREDTDAAYSFCLEALNSSVISADTGYGVAQHALFYVDRFGEAQAITSEQALEVVELIFADIRFQLAGAAQFLAGHDRRPFAKFDEETMEGLRERAQQIMDSPR